MKGGDIVSQRQRLVRLAVLLAAGSIYLLPIAFLGLKQLTQAPISTVFMLILLALAAFCSFGILTSSAQDNPSARSAGVTFFILLALCLAWGYARGITTLFQLGVANAVSTTVTLATFGWLCLQAFAIMGVPDDGETSAEVPMLLTARIIGCAICVSVLCSYMTPAVPGMGGMSGLALTGFTGWKLVNAVIAVSGVFLVIGNADIASKAALAQAIAWVVVLVLAIHPALQIANMAAAFGGMTFVWIVVGGLVVGTLSAAYVMKWLYEELGALTIAGGRMVSGATGAQGFYTPEESPPEAPAQV